MKTTFKISILSLALAALSLGVSAQTSTKSNTANNGVRLSIGAEAGIPVGDFNNVYNANVGGSLQADIPVAEQLFVTVNAGYNTFLGKTISGTNVSYTNLQLIPAKAGLKYFATPNFYVQAEAGASFVTNKKDVGATNSTLFTYAPQVGYLFPLGGKNYIDAGVRYEGNTPLVTNGSNLGFVGLRVSYAFGL
jgi:hypothetical protein